jgi:hypothetical protein
MKINLHIERVIFEGVPIAAASHPAMRTAIVSELANLLAKEGLPGIAAGALPYLSGGALSLTSKSTPAQIGSQIAQALHRAVSVPTSPVR